MGERAAVWTQPILLKTHHLIHRRQVFPLNLQKLGLIYFSLSKNTMKRPSLKIYQSVYQTDFPYSKPLVHTEDNSLNKRLNKRWQNLKYQLHVVFLSKMIPKGSKCICWGIFWVVDGYIFGQLMSIYSSSEFNGTKEKQYSSSNYRKL